MSEFFVWSFFLGQLFFLFPVFVSLDGYLDPAENRVWFSLSIFRLRLFGGYAELKSDGIAVHLTKKKAVYVFYRQMADTRKKFEITKGFQLWKFHQIIETGGAQNPLSVLTAAAIRSAGDAVFSVLQTRYPFLSLKNSILFENRPCLKITFQTTLIFNGLVVTIAITKKILEAIINWIRKKRSIRYLKRQPSN